MSIDTQQTLDADGVNVRACLAEHLHQRLMHLKIRRGRKVTLEMMVGEAIDFYVNAEENKLAKGKKNGG
jgi:hypothetical protein